MDSNKPLLFFVIFLFVILAVSSVVRLADQDSVRQSGTYTVTIYSENGEKMETFENVSEVSEGIFSETISFWKDGKYIRVNAENFAVTQN